MDKRALVVVALAVVGCYSGPPIRQESVSSTPPPVKVEYDRFKNVTWARTRAVPLKWTNTQSLFMVRASAFAVCNGKRCSEEPDYVSLRFEQSSMDWAWLHTRSVILLVDGARAELEVERDGSLRVGGRTVHETLRAKVPTEVFRKLAAAKTVEIQIGAAEFEMGRESTGTFKDLIGLFPSASGDVLAGDDGQVVGSDAQ